MGWSGGGKRQVTGGSLQEVGEERVRSSRKIIQRREALRKGAHRNQEDKL